MDIIRLLRLLEKLIKTWTESTAKNAIAVALESMTSGENDFALLVLLREHNLTTVDEISH